MTKSTTNKKKKFLKKKKEKRGYRKAVRAYRGTLKNKEEGEVGVLPSNFINTEARLCLVFFFPINLIYKLCLTGTLNLNGGSSSV